jgi:hypothetical protein
MSGDVQRGQERPTAVLYALRQTPQAYLPVTYLLATARPPPLTLIDASADATQVRTRTTCRVAVPSGRRDVRNADVIWSVTVDNAL